MLFELALGTDGYAERHNQFMRDYSAKLGRLGSGWWFDSCNRQDNAAWQKEMDACRAGNPDSVIAFSGAEFCASGGQIRPQCPIEDYHAGEIHLLEDGKIRTDFISVGSIRILLRDESQRSQPFQSPALPRVPHRPLVAI